MPKRGYKVASVLAITILIVLAVAGVALAAKWSDINSSVLAGYSLTEQDLINISDGYADGTWQPQANMQRQYFTKMTAKAYNINTSNPGTPIFHDVPSTSIFFPSIQAEYKLGMIKGTSDDFFSPANTITRQQAAAIIARFVANAKGWDLDTFATDEEVASTLENFPDAEAVYPGLKREVAFAINMGILRGTGPSSDTLMIAPTRAMTRIEGAAMITRSLAIATGPTPAKPPAKVELTGDNKAENLIGLTHQFTFKVTDEDNNPVAGALVDFDTEQSPWYVGNVQPEAALTGADGMVTVNLHSSEVGTQRVTAAIAGVGPAADDLAEGTKYWLALDEVYIRDATRSSQNNAGVAHAWEAQVIVFGPGPLSTSQQDWYNLIADDVSTPPVALDGIDGLAFGYGFDYSSYADELDWTADGYHARSMAGIPVLWTVVDGPAEITKIDGAAASGTSGFGSTDADGRSTVEINSTEIGTSSVTAVADYAGNPYPGMLFNHYTGGPDDGDHAVDWDDQPAPYADATKTWIPHTLPAGGDTPISPAYTEANIGETQNLTITLEDVYGNPIEGRQVEWFMQGVGFFVTDDDNTISDPTDPAGNKDFDVTDADGTARLMVKSYDAGEQIIHAKVRDKGIDGNEGQFTTYDAEVQWFDVNVVTFDDPATSDNEAVSTNPVGTTHDFTLWVKGLKLELAPNIDDPAAQTPYIDTDAAGSSYDGVFDWKDAEYLGGILLVNPGRDNDGYTAGLVIEDGVVVDNESPETIVVQGREITLSLIGGYTEYDWNHDGLKEDFRGQTGIYLPLEGKNVAFDLGNGPDTPGDESPLSDFTGMSNLDDGQPLDFDGMVVPAVGTVSPASDVTDAAGTAVVTVASNIKGPETVRAIVDWAGNPHNDSELVKAFAKKAWFAEDGTDVDISVSIEGTEVANNTDGEIAQSVNPALVADASGNMVLNSAHVEVHVRDAFGNDLPDYEVVYLLESLGQTLGGSQGASRTYLPIAYLIDDSTANIVDGVPYDLNDTRPDADEPLESSDPFASIDTSIPGVPAFFFNQWLGAGPDGSPSNVDEGQGLFGTVFDASGNIVTVDASGNPTAMTAGEVRWPMGRVHGGNFNAYQTLDASGNVTDGLVTDGAKAWTLDGYIAANEAIAIALGVAPGDIVPNQLEGSNIDIQLAEDPASAGSGATHFKSILKIMVYAPADGLVTDQTPIWETQVHKVWEEPVVSSIVLTPASDVNPTGQDHQVTATVRDQFGAPMAGVNLYFFGTPTEGGAPYDAAPYFGVPQAWTSNPVVTDANGVASVTGQAVAWSNWNIWAQANLNGDIGSPADTANMAGAVKSNVVTKYWAQEVALTLDADPGAFLTVPAGISTAVNGTGPGLGNRTFNIYKDTPTGVVIGTGVYDNTNGNVVHLTQAIPGTTTVFIQFMGDPLTDNYPNWVFGIPSLP